MQAGQEIAAGTAGPYLLFPGRHLVNTKFQEEYLKRVLMEAPADVPGFMAGKATLAGPPVEVLFAVTSANQDNSRYNPIPFHIRTVGVDRFARRLREQVPFQYRILGIPHYRQTGHFATFTVKEIMDQTEGEVQLRPENCLVLCSTPEVIRLYQELGFPVVTTELAAAAPRPATPIEIISAIAASGAAWMGGALVTANLNPSHAGLFQDFAEVPKRIARLYQDPLTTQDGGLTSTRNYIEYTRSMNEIIDLKYNQIQGAIRPGRIADEGCADGALLTRVSRDFPDSDLLGIDLSAEFASRFLERQRAGEFGGAYAHFFNRNLLDPIFKPASIDTVISHSTLHELWSYGRQEETVRAYLAEKLRQLRPGGRLIVRDVVGPERGGEEVFLHCHDDDGESLASDEWKQSGSRPPEWLRALSTRSRFLVFAHDFLPSRRASQTATFEFQPIEQDSRPGFRISLRLAAEFLSKKDYVENWRSELNEEFCFWSFPRWKEVVKESGFLLLENPNQPEQGCRAYTNPWIVKNRYKGHAELFRAGGSRLPWPPTNMVLVAEKPDR